MRGTAGGESGQIGRHGIVGLDGVGPRAGIRERRNRRRAAERKRSRRERITLQRGPVDHDVILGDQPLQAHRQVRPGEQLRPGKHQAAVLPRHGKPRRAGHRRRERPAGQVRFAGNPDRERPGHVAQIGHTEIIAGAAGRDAQDQVVTPRVIVFGRQDAFVENQQTVIVHHVVRAGEGTFRQRRIVGRRHRHGHRHRPLRPQEARGAAASRVRLAARGRHPQPQE